MVIKRTFAIFTLLIVCLFASCIRNKMSVPNEFIETDPPKFGTDEWYSLNNSGKEFKVSIINENLKIDTTEEINITKHKIPQGILIGINRGEWGGELLFKPTEQSKEQVKIKDGNVKFIFTFKDRLYFIEGLAHEDYSAGAMFELKVINNKFTFNKIIDFEDAPEAFAIYNDLLFIATHSNFYVVNDFKKEIILKNAWSGLYPNSIAAFDEKNVFVGMRGGIAKIDITDKTLKFYKNEK